MRCLYVENFRGFKKEFIPLAEVNFLLGENSTGKSSILGLINLFTSPQLWMQQEFNTDEYLFGNYSDILSVNAKDAGFFRIGLIECSEEELQRKKAGVYTFLMEFYEKDGVPSISKYCYINQQNSVQILFEKSQIRYRVDSFNSGNRSSNSVRETFKTWLNPIPPELEFKKLKAPIRALLSTNRPIPVITGIIDEETKLSRKDEEISLFLRMPDFSHGFAWIAPIRSKPKRTYDQFKFSFSPEGDHAPYLIRKYLGNDNLNKQGELFKKFVEEFGKKSGLMTGLDIKKFGNDSASPFELDILLEDGNPINISSVGYGVSQSLPILVEVFARPSGSWFAIQQPEVHLHPRAQAALGDVFYSLAANKRKHFFIETHSDFIIDRFRMNLRKSDKKVGAQVLFFERKDGFNNVSSIPILSAGKYSDSQPESFRKFFIKEELSLLGIR
jgi:hypothetical protein